MLLAELGNLPDVFITRVTDKRVTSLLCMIPAGHRGGLPTPAAAAAGRQHHRRCAGGLRLPDSRRRRHPGCGGGGRARLD